MSFFIWFPFLFSPSFSFFFFPFFFFFLSFFLLFSFLPFLLFGQVHDFFIHSSSSFLPKKPLAPSPFLFLFLLLLLLFLLSPLPFNLLPLPSPPSSPPPLSHHRHQPAFLPPKTHTVSVVLWYSLIFLLSLFQKEEKGRKEGEVVYLGFGCSSSSVWCSFFLVFLKRNIRYLCVFLSFPLPLPLSFPFLSIPSPSFLFLSLFF